MPRKLRWLLCSTVMFASVVLAQSGSPTGICHYRNGGTGPCLPETSPATPIAPNIDYGALRQFGASLTKSLLGESDASIAHKLNDQGTRLYEQKHYAEAAQAFAEALKHEPYGTTIKMNLRRANSLVHNENGIYLLNIGNPRGALDEFEVAVQIDPDNQVLRDNVAFARNKLAEQPAPPRKQDQPLTPNEIISRDCPSNPIPEGGNTFFYQCNKQDRAATPYCLERKEGWIREVPCH